jgi:hypothetical protein
MFAALLALAAPARAQDAGATDGDTGATDGGPRTSPTCPDAVWNASAPVAFMRSGPVDFGPGTGMMMVGSRSTVGMEYNLLFSGTYQTGMRGRLNLR